MSSRQLCSATGLIFPSLRHLCPIFGAARENGRVAGVSERGHSCPMSLGFALPFCCPGARKLLSRTGLGGVGVFIVDEEDKFCEFDGDCIFVSNACSDCGGDTVNKAYKEKYVNLWHKVCADYNGPLCDWDYTGAYEIRCVNSKCDFVLKETDEYFCNVDKDCEIKVIDCDKDCSPCPCINRGCVNKEWDLDVDCSIPPGLTCPPETQVWVNNCKCVNSKCVNCRDGFPVPEGIIQCRVNGDIINYTK